MLSATECSEISPGLASHILINHTGINNVGASALFIASINFFFQVKSLRSLRVLQTLLKQLAATAEKEIVKCFVSINLERFLTSKTDIWSYATITILLKATSMVATVL